MGKSKCAFCQLQRTDRVFYKDSVCYAVLDLNELTKGHTLLIPMKHYENMLSTPEKVISHMYKVAKHLSIKINKTFGAEGSNILTSSGTTAGQDIMHFHIHIIPRYRTSQGVIRFYYLDSKLKDPQGKEKRLTTLKNLFTKSEIKR